MPRKKADTLVNQQVGIRLSSHEKLCAESDEAYPGSY